ncbi:MAG: hypothetical protein JW982_05000 [Spirochaetes bacterium]|nr:hypothetical protein [Spirochaetota bacterium]
MNLPNLMSSLLPLFIILGVYSILSIIFAFVTPPKFIDRIFTVPGIFVFLPQKYVMPVGRIFVGVAGLGLIAFLAVGILKVI